MILLKHSKGNSSTERHTTRYKRFQQKESEYMDEQLKGLKTNYNALLDRINKALDYFDNQSIVDELSEEQLKKMIKKYNEYQDFRIKNLKKIEEQQIVSDEEIVFGLKGV